MVQAQTAHCTTVRVFYLLWDMHIIILNVLHTYRQIPFFIIFRHLFSCHNSLGRAMQHCTTQLQFLSQASPGNNIHTCQEMVDWGIYHTHSHSVTRLCKRSHWCPGLPLSFTSFQIISRIASPQPCYNRSTAYVSVRGRTPRAPGVYEWMPFRVQTHNR